jgi:phage terminase large subunit-like protein
MTATRQAPRRRQRAAPSDLALRSLMVPAIEAEPWPSLGGQVCAFIEELLCHGPGDVLGDPITLLDEARVIIWRAYEVYPPGHPQAGRRRFKRVAISRRKGWSKTELLALLAIVELDPEGPVRCDGFDAYGQPVGRGVRDPYIPLVATTEEQSDELAFGAAREILMHCDLGNNYDVGLERISPRDSPGKMVSLASSPSARDGARTSMQGFDETHGFVREGQKAAHSTMLRNVPKRLVADAWSLEIGTMYEPGEGSIAQQTHEYALDVARGRVADTRLYYDHRQASLVWDLSRRGELMKAIKEASGDALAYADVEGIASIYLDPSQDRQEFRRFYLNQRVKGSGRWFAPDVLERLVQPRRMPSTKNGARPKVVLAFDGSDTRDSTVIVGATVSGRPHVWLERIWERPMSLKGQEWRVPRREVDAAVDEAMERYDVIEFAPDPPGWHREIEEWEERWGDQVVVRFETKQPARMGPAADQFEQLVKDGGVSLDGSEPLMRHLENCMTAVRRGYRVPVKAADDSPDKIDAGVGAVIAASRAMWHELHRAKPFTWKVAK